MFKTVSYPNQWYEFWITCLVEELKDSLKTNRYFFAIPFAATSRNNKNHHSQMNERTNNRLEGGKNRQTMNEWMRERMQRKGNG